MKSLRDDQLLRRWAERRSQEAFAEIGRRYVGMVFGVCLRELGDPVQAEDAAQAVFLLLAQKAPHLRKEGALAGWLFRAARFVSQSARRQERRRADREAQAAREVWGRAARREENALWDEIEPLLNDALARLKPADREALLLRHFEGRSLAEIGAALGVSENTARMRVSRAVEKLRARLAKAGVAVSAAALAALLSERGAQAASYALTLAVARIAGLGSGGLVAAALTTAPLAASHLTSSHSAVSTLAAASQVHALAKGAKIAMTFSAIKTAAALCAAVTITGLLGGAITSAIATEQNSRSAPRAEALLQTVAAAVQQTRSLTCECDKITHDPNTGRDAQTLYVVSLLRPNFVREERYQVSAAGAASGRKPLVGLLSDGVTRRTLLPSGLTEDEPAEARGKNAGLLLPDPLYDFYAPENAYAELVRQSRADGSLTALTLDAGETWEGAAYQVVTFTKTSRANGRLDVYKTRFYVGADNLVHRTTVQDGAGVLLTDIRLRNVRLNTPLAPADFHYTPGPLAPEPPKALAPFLLPVGAPAPDFTLFDSRGKPVSLAGLRGKTVVLDFWATWCQPCQIALPNTARVAAQRASKGVVVLAVNVSDTQAAFNAWVPRHPEYAALRFAIDPRADGKDVATLLYHVNSLPTQYVISPQGRVAGVFVGYDPSTKELERALDRAAK